MIQAAWHVVAVAVDGAVAAVAVVAVVVLPCVFWCFGAFV
jgi:hypothetical protein